MRELKTISKLLGAALLASAFVISFVDLICWAQSEMDVRITSAPFVGYDPAATMDVRITSAPALGLIVGELLPMTKAELLAWTPAKSGLPRYCSDCSVTVVAVSTGSAKGAVSDAVGKDVEVN